LRHITTLLDDPSLFLATIHPAIKFMQAYDEENSTDYLHTLETYIQKNRSAPAAAEALHIHKSTFFYRLEKMKSLFNIDVSNPDNMFAYEISLKILDISKKYRY
jgi:DNA-binding PucR family transcriptional regulator